MKSNLGFPDRAIRAVLGLLLVLSGLYYDMWFWVVGVVLLLTAAIRWCPLYALFGASTCDTRRRGASDKKG